MGGERPIALEGTNDEEYKFAGRWARAVVQSALRGSWEVVNNQAHGQALKCPPPTVGSTPKMAGSGSTETTSHSPRLRASRAVNAAAFSLSRCFDVSCLSTNAPARHLLHLPEQ